MEGRIRREFGRRGGSKRPRSREAELGMEYRIEEMMGTLEWTEDLARVRWGEWDDGIICW